MDKRRTVFPGADIEVEHTFTKSAATSETAEHSKLKDLAESDQPDTAKVNNSFGLLNSRKVLKKRFPVIPQPVNPVVLKSVEKTAQNRVGLGKPKPSHVCSNSC